MDKQQNIEARPGDAERPQESGAASPGRGGRMSRQRKTAAVLRLLRGEDLETVSRGLGVTAATLSGWRDAFLAAGEAALATKSATGEELESDRLKAKLGAALIERDLLHEKIAVLEGPTALCRYGRSGNEQGCFAGNRQTVWAGGGLLVPGASPALAFTATFTGEGPAAVFIAVGSLFRRVHRHSRPCASHTL